MEAQAAPLAVGGEQPERGGRRVGQIGKTLGRIVRCDKRRRDGNERQQRESAKRSSTRRHGRTSVTLILIRGSLHAITMSASSRPSDNTSVPAAAHPATS